MTTGPPGKSIRLLKSVADGSMVAVRNRESLCEGKGIQEDFLQESTETDKVKIFS